MNQNHTVNDTDLNKIYAFDKIAKLLSDNKFEAITDKEEVRGLHRDSETGKVSEYVYTTFLGETKYKLNLTSDEVWELLCYLLEGMDKVIDENGCQITRDAFGFKHEYSHEYSSKSDHEDEVKEDGSDSCCDSDVHNVNGLFCDLDNIPVSLSCDENSKVSVGYELIYSDDVDDFGVSDPYGEKPINGINLYGVICDGTTYKDSFDIQGPENWRKFKEALGVSDENLTYFNKKLNRYEIDWDRILQLYKEGFYTTSGYRWIAKPCKNIVYKNKGQIDKLNKKFDESRISKVTKSQGTLTAGYKKLYHVLTPDDKKDKVNGNSNINDNDNINSNINDGYVIGVKLYAVDTAGAYYNDYFCFFDDFELKDGQIYAKLDGCKNYIKMQKELGVYGVVQADGSKIELIKWNPRNENGDKSGEGQFEYDWDTILTAYKSAFYDCFGYRRKNIKAGVG